jgi:carotenoid 1,2-hydratase
MTERDAGSVRRGTDFLTIGPSALEWDGHALTVRIQEVGMPFARRIRGTVRVVPPALESTAWLLDSAGRHRWQPIAPCARVEVRIDQPSVSWSGPGYFDTNDGDRPLEADFIRWDWSRAPVEGGTAVLYDLQRRDGPMTLALRYRREGGVEVIPPVPPVALPRTRWRVPRFIGAGSPTVEATLEDTPFYARSVVGATLLGQTVTAMHESLSLDRFAHPLVQAMLPFRMPRNVGSRPKIQL